MDSYCTVLLYSITLSTVVMRVNEIQSTDPPYPLHQLRRTCVAIAFPRTAAAAERGN